MTDIDRLTAALSDRYLIERELGSGGMGPQITQKRADERGWTR
jgi:hypothetical protein